MEALDPMIAEKLNKTYAADSTLILDISCSDLITMLTSPSLCWIILAKSQRPPSLLSSDTRDFGIKVLQMATKNMENLSLMIHHEICGFKII